MTTEPTVTFLDLACAIGADAAHARTIQGNLERLFGDALSGKISPRCLGWNLHSDRKRSDRKEYLLMMVRPDRSGLSLLPDWDPITRLGILEAAVYHWPPAERALGLLEAGVESDAYRLLIEEGLPDEGSPARLFVESLAVTASEAWRFCERNGLRVPAVLRRMLAEWVVRRRSWFAPEGYIAIPDALTEIREALSPGESQHARAELEAHQSGELPASYYRHCENEDKAEKLLLRLLSDGMLVAVNSDKWPVPPEYWETNSARVVTLTNGTLDARESSPERFRKHHGQSCFIEEAPFRRWLGETCVKTAPTEATSATAAKAFDRTQWDYMMVLAWVCLRDRAVVEQAAFGAENGRTFYQEERLPDGRIEIVESYAGPTTPRLLTSLVALRRTGSAIAPTPTMLPYEAKADIIEKLSADSLTASGLKNDAGDRQLIPCLGWIDLEIKDEVSDSRTYAGPKERTRSGATRWYELLFEREQVLTVWPDLSDAGPSRTVGQPAGGLGVGSANADGFVSDVELQEWLTSYFDAHKTDAKHPQEKEIERASRDHFSPRKLRKLRPTVRSTTRPPEWNEKGRTRGS